MSNPFTFNFAANNSNGKQSKDFKRSVSKTVSTKPWSKLFSDFSFSLIIQKKKKKHFRNLH